MTIRRLIEYLFIMAIVALLLTLAGCGRDSDTEPVSDEKATAIFAELINLTQTNFTVMPRRQVSWTPTMTLVLSNAYELGYHVDITTNDDGGITMQMTRTNTP